MLYAMNFILPLLYFLVLDVASFFINEARGEKLGFKVTLLLSVSVLLLILQDMLPSTTEKLPHIGEGKPLKPAGSTVDNKAMHCPVFLSLSMTVSLWSYCSSVLSCHLHIDDHEPPGDHDGKLPGGHGWLRQSGCSELQQHL